MQQRTMFTTLLLLDLPAIIKLPPKSLNADRLNGKALQLNIYWL